MKASVKCITSVLLAAVTTVAMAGRPLATDDAAVADTGSCQVEAWHERQTGERATVVAPACGIAEHWELGGDITRSRSSGDRATGVGLASKWVPEGGRFDTALGPLTLGAKLALGAQRPTGAAWRTHTVSALGLATLEITPELLLHVNLGPVRERDPRSNFTVFNSALAWSVSERALLFIEGQATDSSAQGGTVRTGGARWWLFEDSLGLDVTASRQSGSSSGTRWSVGLGWYRLGL